MKIEYQTAKVLFLHPFDALAGSQRVASTLVRAFRGLSIPVEVLLGFGNNGFVSQIPEVKRFMAVNRVGLRKALYPLWLAMLLPRMVWAVWRGETVWANTVHAIPATIPMLWLAPGRVVLHVHEVEFPGLFQWLLRWGASRGAHVLCVSDYHRQRLGIQADVLSNCVDHASDTEPQHPPTLLFVGAASAIKGFPLFVEVARRLPPGQVQAIACVPAPPPASRELIEIAEASGVKLRYGLSDPVAMFDGATLLMQCTDPTLWTETFSLVMVEALACGVPVATSGMAVAPEILGDAWAFDVPSRDPDRIVAEVLSLLEDGQRLQSLRAAARARRAHFSFERFQLRVNEVLSKTTGTKAC